MVKVSLKVAAELFLLIMIMGGVGCTSFYRRFYTDPERCFAEAKKCEPYDAIIVPGFPHDTTNWHDIVKIRVYWSYYLYSHGYTKNVIYSGSAVYSPYVESKIMALYAEKLGIPREHIFEECRAEHSTENLYFSMKLADSIGFKRVALASDPSQSSFLKSLQHKFDIDIAYIPIVYDTLKVMQMVNPAIDPSSAFIKDFVALPDRESFYKRLRGTQGRRVKQLMREERREKKRQQKALKKD